MSYMSFMDWYQINFELKEYRGGGVWSLDEIGNMFPYEREIYMILIRQRVEDRRQDEENA